MPQFSGEASAQIEFPVITLADIDDPLDDDTELWVSGTTEDLSESTVIQITIDNWYAGPMSPLENYMSRPADRGPNSFIADQFFHFDGDGDYIVDAIAFGGVPRDQETGDVSAPEP